MTEDTDERPTEDRVEQLLRAAREELDDESSEEPSSSLRDVAAEADELIESATTETLLEATGTDLPEGSGPETIPKALSESDPESVAELRTLFLLSELSETEDDAAAEPLEELRELTAPGDAATTAADEAEEESGTGDETDEHADEAAEDEERAETDGEPEAESEPVTESSAEPDDSSDADSDESTALMAQFGEELDLELTSSLDDFREEIEAAQSSLRDQVTEPDESDEADETSETSTAEDDAPDETSTAEDDATDTVADPGHRRNTFSSIPSANRPDMRQPRRLSTLQPSSADDEEE
ncbi:hypothetical protein [Haloarcula nitratireducens]|uniref:Uncharacterized protein n=1 Tax=Haloarcula nitratireducens TaxID=2487749 RepID=A0AAW4PCM0_9EURY|nr:hypothetical protein [Halomicroarcula nitratireducens]MBX0295333.1 hypothetical protein [Halomicroarcula nitratireducens]